MAFKPRSRAEIGKEGAVSVVVLRRQLRQSDLNDSNDAGEVALFDFLDLELDFLIQLQNDIAQRLKVADPINLVKQVSGQLQPKNGGSYSGKYTPILTDVTNLTSSVAYECYYTVVGNVVSVFGTFEVEPTAGSAQTQLGISLPILSYFIDEGQCAGISSCPALSPENATIIADIVNFRAQVDWISGFSGSSEKFWFNFSYQLVAQS